MQFCLMEKRRDSSIHAKWILIEFSNFTQMEIYFVVYSFGRDGMFFIGGLCEESDSFVLPIIKHGGSLLFPISENVQDLAQHEEFGHVYKYVFPNTAILQNATSSQRYVPIDHYALGKGQVQAIIQYMSLSGSGLARIVTDIFEMHDDLNREMDLSTKLMNKLNWHDQVCERIKDPIFIIDSKMRVMMISRSGRKFFGIRSAKIFDDFPAWFSSFGDIIKTCIENKEYAERLIVNNDETYVVHISPVVLRSKNKTQKLCNVRIYKPTPLPEYV